MSEGVDTAIVGAGIVGLATAHALCRDGAGSRGAVRPLVARRGDSGRSFSMVRRHYSNEVVARLAIDGLAHDHATGPDEVGGGRRRVRPLRLPADGARAARCEPAAATSRCCSASAWTRVSSRRTRSPRSSRELSTGGRRRRGLRARGRVRRRAEDVPGLVRRGGLARAAAPPRLGGAGDPGRERPRDRRRDRCRGSCRRDGSCWPPGRGRTICCARSAPAADRAAPAPGRDPANARRAGRCPRRWCSDAVTNVVVRPDRGRQFCAVAYAGEDVLERADDCDHGSVRGYLDAVAERPRGSASRAWPSSSWCAGSPGPTT